MEIKKECPFKKGDYVRIKHGNKWVKIMGIYGVDINTDEYGWRHFDNFIGFNQLIDRLKETQ
ncbi:hypothetical protein LCGC14_2567800 [marine sediment metagenome]|uniref:Uncharacterized protein n=1 Tax=marine sediment metagenome TaxID=412755 RepID=A0A0F9AI53_9ZZZZ